MPTTKKDLPGTLKRSPAKAQRTYAETLDSAEEQYDSPSARHRAAWAAVKHSFEKVGDHWEAKDEKGPSDPQSAQRGTAARDRPKATHGGVDVRGQHEGGALRAGPQGGRQGRSSMSKGELADALTRNRESSPSSASHRAPIARGLIRPRRLERRLAVRPPARRIRHQLPSAPVRAATSCAGTSSPSGPGVTRSAGPRGQSKLTTGNPLPIASTSTSPNPSKRELSANIAASANASPSRWSVPRA